MKPRSERRTAYGRRMRNARLILRERRKSERRAGWDRRAKVAPARA